MTLKLEQILGLKTETGNPTQIIESFAKFSFKNCLRHFRRSPLVVFTLHLQRINQYSGYLERRKIIKEDTVSSILTLRTWSSLLGRKSLSLNRIMETKYKRLAMEQVLILFTSDGNGPMEDFLFNSFLLCYLRSELLSGASLILNAFFLNPTRVLAD